MIAGWITVVVFLGLFLYSHEQLSRARRKLALVLLHQRGGWMSGLDVIKESDGAIPQGIVYVILVGLHDDGLVERRTDIGGLDWYRSKRGSARGRTSEQAPG